MTPKPLSFKTNVGLKDLVGRGLIFDDNIAIIELIKNSKDADSKTVHIDFVENKDQLIISDEGCGMTLDDIVNKWLNIAYSEKRSKKEEDKQYAGNKGIGRFSCDRLGKNLTLYTKAKNGKYLKVHIDWTRFEIDKIDADISSIEFEHEVLSRNDFLAETESHNSFAAGSILVIEKLRSSWTKKKFDKLKSELEKFVAAPDEQFEVFLSLPGEKKKLITNNVFEELKYRTYYIESEIDKSGKTIKTTLYYNREVLYTFTCKNPYQRLKSVKTLIYYLSFTSKAFFKRSTKITSSDYGSVFLFLNGFRVSPYGNPKNDWLGIDQRKAQGVSRYFGTRDVIGRVELTDDNDEFHPLTSREGLVENTAFRELVAHEKDHKVKLSNDKTEYGFIPHIVRQLEKVVVGGLNWHSIVSLDGTNKVVSDSDIKKDPTRYSLKRIDPVELTGVIEKVINSSNFEIENFEINKTLITQLSQEAEDAYNEYILTFIENTTDKNFEDLSPKEKGDIKKIAADNMHLIRERKKEAEKLLEAERKAEEAQARAKDARIRAAQAEKLAKEQEARAKAAEESSKKTAGKLKEAEDENLFLRKDASKDSDDLINLHHQIVIYSSTAASNLENLKAYIFRNEKLDSEKLLDYISKVQTDLTKISKVSGYATNQNYRIALESVKGNLLGFISDYLQDLSANKLGFRRIDIVNNIDLSKRFDSTFSPLSVMIIIDNLLSNAKRAKATKVVFTNTDVPTNTLIRVSDNGQGLAESIKDREMIFKKGFTTTEGSGRGLYHTRETLRQLGADIIISPSEKGTVFEVIKC